MILKKTLSLLSVVENSELVKCRRKLHFQTKFFFLEVGENSPIENNSLPKIHD